MDVALSLVTGLGLRVYLLRITFPASFISPIILGLLEGILVHRLSFHPPPFVSSSPLDHYLALGLRFLVDFLIGDWSRVKIVALWVVIGTSISELLFPGFPSNFDASVKTSPSSRTRRQRPRSNASHVPSCIRVYQEPEELPSRLPASTPIKSTIQVDTHTSRSDDQTFISPNFPLPTPPSFFLHPESEPSPFPDSPTSSLKPAIAPVSSPVQTRPTSALAFYETGKSTQLAEIALFLPCDLLSCHPHLQIVHFVSERWTLELIVCQLLMRSRRAPSMLAKTSNSIHHRNSKALF